MITFHIEGGCGDPDSPAHGRLIGSDFSYNSVVRYECNEGYVLVGSEERRCQADGKWSCEQPRCLTAGDAVPFNIGRSKGRPLYGPKFS